MSARALNSRIGYAVGAFAVASVAGFYLSISLLHHYALGPQSTEGEMYDVFVTSLWLGALAGFSAGMVGLTLPWLRRKRRSGRGRRTAVAGVIVLVASVLFATTVHSLLYDLGFALWLAYVVSFTYVRYGVRDRGRASADETKAQGVSANYVD